MALEPEDVKSIAHLARLGVDDDKLAEYAAEISSAFELIDTISEVNTEGVEPMAHPAEAVQRLRSDCVTEPDARDALLACAPATEKGLFLVPKVID